MSSLARLAKSTRDILLGRTEGLGTRSKQREGSVYIEKPPIEAGQGIRRSLRRRLEDMGLRSRLQRVDRENLTRQPQPPALGVAPPPPPGKPLDDIIDPGGRLPPPFPAGRRGYTEDEWIEEWQRRKAAEKEREREYDEVEVLGRSFDYDEDEFQLAMANSVKVESSNVYSYFWQPESKYSGILYVTFLAPSASKNSPRTGAGPTYAYYGVTTQKYRRFRTQALESPGSAVWDHLRVRGTIFGHQVQYRLVAVTGEYVPRKATRKGFRTRYLKPLGNPSQVNARLPANATNRERELYRRGFRRSTLPAQDYGQTDRGTPDRGAPDRGQ